MQEWVEHPFQIASGCSAATWFAIEVWRRTCSGLRCPAGAETAVILPRKRAFGVSGPQKTGQCRREEQFPQPKPEKFPKSEVS